MADGKRLNSAYSALIAARLDEKERELLVGKAADWGDYRAKDSYMDALRWAIDECETFYAKHTGGQVRNE